MKNNSNILFPFSNKKLTAASKPSILLYFNAISVILFSNKRFFLCVCLCIGSLTFSFSQDKKAALEAKKQKLLKEIEYTQQQLEKTKASKNASLADVQALSKQVELRKKLITEIETEVNSFLNYYEKNPNAKVLNPFFGEFNYEQWLHLLHKHAVHHLKQFNLA